MASFDILPYVVSVQALPQAVRTADTTSSGIDLAGYEAALVQLTSGVVTAGTYTPQVEESDDNSTFTAVDDKYLVGPGQEIAGQEALAIINATNQTKLIGYVGKRRYIRVKITSASGNMLIAANVLLSAPKSV